MANIKFEGAGDVLIDLQKMAAVPPEVKTKMLNEMGRVAAAAERQSALEMGVYDPESNVHIADNIKVNKPKITETGGTVTVTFTGTRKRGNKKTRNAEIAFVNEFGRRGKTKRMKARPFIATALKKSGDAINAAGEKVYNEWLDSIEQNR